MAQLSHDFGGPVGTNLRVRQSELRTPRVLLVHTTIENGRVNESFYRNKPLRPWRDARLVLRGEAEVEAHNSDGGARLLLGAGSVVFGESFRAWRLRSTSPDIETLRLCWRQGGPLAFVDCAPEFRLDAAGMALAHDVATLLDRRERPAPRTVVRLFAALTRAPFPSDHSPPWTSGPADERFAEALNEVLTPMSRNPATTDLADRLACSERQVRRMASNYFRRLHVTVSSWRDYVAGLRFSLGGIAMSHAGARTDAVAAWLGFASASSFCHAFQRVALPAPRRFRMAVPFRGGLRPA